MVTALDGPGAVHIERIVRECIAARTPARATDAINRALNALLEAGSAAAPGFMRPEGIIVFHSASQQVYKVLAENDDMPKGLAR